MRTPRFTKSSFLMMTHPVLDFFSFSWPVSWMIFQQQMVVASTQSSLPHAPNEVSWPQKFFSTHHDEQYMHEPKSKMLSGPASSFLADESNENICKPQIRLTIIVVVISKKINKIRTCETLRGAPRYTCLIIVSFVKEYPFITNNFNTLENRKIIHFFMCAKHTIMQRKENNLLIDFRKTYVELNMLLPVNTDARIFLFC